VLRRESASIAAGCASGVAEVLEIVTRVVMRLLAEPDSVYLDLKYATESQDLKVDNRGY
jgi:hypothetical protein